MTNKIKIDKTGKSFITAKSSSDFDSFLKVLSDNKQHLPEDQLQTLLRTV